MLLLTASIQVDIQDRHPAYGDAVATAAIFQRLALRLTQPDHPVAHLIQRQTRIGQFISSYPDSRFRWFYNPAQSESKS